MKTTFGTALDLRRRSRANEAGANRPTASRATTMAALRRLTTKGTLRVGTKAYCGSTPVHHTFSTLSDASSDACLGTLLVHRRTTRGPRTIGPMPNRLAGETSPYLLQHANNPVDWFPWGPDALARREAPRPADLPVDRLRGLSLVSRDGTRVVRARADRPLPERPVRGDQGRPRGAARPRPGLHGAPSRR